MLVISLVFIVLLLILSGTKRKADRSDSFMELFMFLEWAEERARERGSVEGEGSGASTRKIG